jgi:hypothetical protein
MLQPVHHDRLRGGRVPHPIAVSQSPCHGSEDPGDRNRWKTRSFGTSTLMMNRIGSHVDETDLYGLEVPRFLDKF